MKYLKVGAAVLNQTPLDWEGNQQRIEVAIKAAKEAQISVLCLPELCISGYGCEDMFLSPATLLQSKRVLSALVSHTESIIVAVGLPLSYQNRIYNVVCLLANGKICGFVAKRFLAGDGIHYEPRWFQAWPEDISVELEFNGQHYPLGDIYFNCGGVRIGFEICEEAWVANRPGIKLAQRGVDIILNPSASHFAFDKHAIRQRFVLEGSRAFSVSYIYTNLLGNESGRAIYDGDALCASRGQLLASNPRFSFADYQLISAFIDVDLTRIAQARTGEAVPNLDTRVYIPFDFAPLQPTANPQCVETWELSPALREEEFARAEALGLFDYLRKSRSHGFVLSLSGGADSAAIACLIRLMVMLGVRELGMEGFCQKLAYFPLQKTDINGLMSQLLTCVYQATCYSGEITEKAAETLAFGLNASYLKLDVDFLRKGYIDLISQAINRTLHWDKDDLALQNIQARIRAPSVWLLANLKNALLLATSNRSEAALGYATMDGDTCGGLSPLAGIDKAFLRRWLCWLETQGVHDLGVMPYLHLVNNQQPTAELRPAEMQQTDEADLMPYEVVNIIEKAMVRDRQTPQEIVLLLKSLYPEQEQAQLILWVTRFFRLWSRNQWKRERYAPSFHLDDENVDPKTGCRFPILSGGFEWELKALSDNMLL
ncbi:NAD(+) synthase [Thioflexithrix psekupsensis]|uniref:Glutamine-dependent NAD(+) synthetase n=1 Tax=Thioflexithrix psekupsensis TaxID=1570016 RepID=A0A251XBY9_9GAMM|nr:NAD(+) synthase [Thioflexithrix psekupsensis]OUD16063.1 NAD(+) synthase [Thioflexithrix psekupsensis]